MTTELIINRCPNPRAISVEMGTLKAWKWIQGAMHYFTDMTQLLHALKHKNPSLPYEAVLVVRELYEFDKVYAYLKSAPFLQEKATKKQKG